MIIDTIHQYVLFFIVLKYLILFTLKKTYILTQKCFFQIFSAAFNIFNIIHFYFLFSTWALFKRKLNVLVFLVCSFFLRFVNLTKPLATSYSLQAWLWISHVSSASGTTLPLSYCAQWIISVSEGDMLARMRGRWEEEQLC